MANRYANIPGASKISQTYNLITEGFDKVQQDVDQLQDGLAQEIADREAAVQAVDERVDQIISEPSPNKDPELVDIRTPDSSYTPGRTINVAGDITRDMQAQLMSHKADIAIITPKRFEGETSDTPAINRALAELTAMGGGFLRWHGTLEITSPIVINNEKIQFSGLGETSKIKVMDLMDYAIKIEFHSLYGNRGLNWENFYLDCNNLAKDGLLVGGSNPVVQSTFTNIKIYNTIEYGLVLDASQNNTFISIDVEYCGGNVKLLNGAGNNLFLRGAFNAPDGLHQIYLGMDPDYEGYNLNIFSRVPSSNNFVHCITERGQKQTCIFIEHGKDNSFIRHEFESGSVTDCVIRFGAGANLNKVSGRIAHFSNTNTPIINSGNGNKIYDLYIENFVSTHFAQTSNKLILSNVRGTKEISVQNTAGDASYNIETEYARFLGATTDPYTATVLPSEIVFNDRGIYFKNKNNIMQFQTGRHISGTVNSSGTSHEMSLQLPLSGSWVIDVYACNGDRNHSRSNTFSARFRSASVNHLADIQKANEDVVSGFLVSSLDAIIDELGNLTITATTSSSTSLTFFYDCRQVQHF